MLDLKARKPLLIRILAVVLLILMCFNLPSLLFWPLCLKRDLFRSPNTELLVSACRRPVARGVPGGKALFVYEVRTDKMYLLDLRTGEKRDVPDDPLLLDKGIFLSSELVWLEGSLVGPDNPNYRPHYILDLTNGQYYELLDLTWLQLKDGKFDPRYYAYFQSAGQVFIDHTENRLIALSANFRQHPERNVILSGSSLGLVTSNTSGELLEQLMRNLGMDYEIIDFSLRYADFPSPTGRYVVRGDGIYLSGTNTPVVIREMGWYFRGWYYDESGVVFQDAGSYLIKLPEVQGYYPIPTPILKLRMPGR